MSSRAVIIVAGGTGTRMNSPLAKQFMLLGGKPILIHTFEAFLRFDAHMQFVLVLFPSLRAQWRALCEAHAFDCPHIIVEGGAERFHSVKAGLAALDKHVKLVAVHDAVRPLVSHDTISKSFDAAAKYGAAAPVMPLKDTIRQVQVSGDESKTLPRASLVAVQTPQVFDRRLLDEAYLQPYEVAFTDDCSVVEHLGQRIQLCPGNAANIKITTPEDLVVGEALLAHANNF